MNSIRVVLVDDHEIVRRGLALLLDAELDIEIVGEAAAGIAAIECVHTHKPDLVLLDLMLPGMSGMHAALVMKQISPDTRILVISGVNSDDAIISALESNIDGYVLKDAPSTEIIHAIRIIAGGQAYIQPAVAKRMLRRMAARAHPTAVPVPPPLTQRELDVLRMLATTRSTKDIAQKLVLSEETVRSHTKRILQKLNQPNRTQAVLAALRLGLIELN